MRVVAENLTFRYKNSDEVLRGLNFEIDPGESVAVMGPSGSGKSTLLHLLGGISRPTSGRALLDGSAASQAQSGVAWVFQTVNVVRSRTALDNVAMGLYRHFVHWRSCLPPASDALARVGLTHCSDRRVEDLSGGELQRVVVARALVGQPSLILADEPTGQLDTASTNRVVDALINARTSKTTLVIATHDSSVASKCNRLLRLDFGRIIE